MPFQIRPISKEDEEWIAGLLKEWFSGPKVVTRRKVHYGDSLPGFIAVHRGKRAGLITYRIDGKDCEVITMNSLIERIGIGSVLLDEVKKAAVSKGCKRLCLVTTNDNTAALRFYQKRGFHIAIVRVNAMEEYRKLKPEIPLAGNDGIPIRDEIELEMEL